MKEIRADGTRIKARGRNNGTKGRVAIRNKKRKIEKK
jgi:hypothetical protein